LSDTEPEPELESELELEVRNSEVQTLSGTPSSYTSANPDIMDAEPPDAMQRLAALEDEFQRRQEEANQRHEELLTILQTLRPRSNPTLPQPTVPNFEPELATEPPRVTTNSEVNKRVKAALPSDYDGNRKNGQTFLNSCQLYIELSGEVFTNDQRKIHWALTFCKSGRAAKFADRILRSERSGTRRYQTWTEFVKDFTERFCESNEQVRALTKLEGDSWHQRAMTVDDYIDTFEDLVDLADLTTDAGLVMKFRRGLSKEIQDKVAEMESPPDLDDLKGWKDAARRFYQNVEANRAFSRNTRSVTSSSLSGRTLLPVRPNPVPRAFPNLTVPTTSRPNPFTNFHANFGNKAELGTKPKVEEPVPMDVDTSKYRKPMPPVCFRCHQPGHRANECPHRFDVRAMTADERMDLLEQLLADADLAQVRSSETTSDVTPEVQPELEESDFDSRNE
jgi:Retrotransposon gag protein/Zinc knuckle